MYKSFRFNILFTSIFLLLATTATANVRLPKIFGEGMVLQRNQPIRIWGWAEKGEKISVRFNKQIKVVKAGNEGKWEVLLNPESAGGPYQLIIKGNDTIVLEDVLVGEVWVCSGQSNMEFLVSAALNAKEEIQNADYPEIRHLKISKAMAREPQNDLETSAVWKVCNPENVGEFTAVGYFYARELYKELHVPIGLIHASWGGTDIETWISQAALEKSDLFKDLSKPYNRRPNLQQLIEQRRKKVVQAIKDIQGNFPDTASTQKWKRADFGTTKWPVIKIPGLWEQSIEGFDGIVWFKKTITLSAKESGKTALLELGRIDDSDETYVNGIKVGGLKDKYNEKRIYPVSAGILKEGENIIVVRVEDNGGGGGIYGTPDEVKITIDDKVYSLASEWEYQVETVFENSFTSMETVGDRNGYPTLLFNAMIHPLTKFAIKGVIWYQGENNVGRAYQYRKTFPLMIEDWRNHWQQGNFPFYFVQLASWKASNGNSNAGSYWAELREAQSLTLSTPNTGMAVTIDIGDRDDIHPKNKQDVGKRLAAIALNKTYGKHNTFSGPVLDTAIFKGKNAILKFEYASSGFMIKDKYGYLKGFEIAGADKKFYYAKAVVEGNTIVVSHDSVPDPIAIRYAWADDAGDANLYNKDGFPMAPFRTDDWVEISRNVKYNIR